MNGKIIVCYHKEAPIIKNEILQPMLLNAEVTGLDGFELRDNIANNISRKNNMYCELTAIYAIWKNSVYQFDYIGLFHYRRVLLLEPDVSESLPKFDFFETNYLNRPYDYYGLNKQQVDKLMSVYDIILPIETELRTTVYNQYKDSLFHHEHHLNFAIEYIMEKYAEYQSALNMVMRGYRVSFYNMFIMKQYLFNQYCEWLFPILKYVEDHVREDGLNVQELRYVAYISERLLNVFVYHHTEINNIKVKYCHALFLNFEDSNLRLKEILMNKKDVVIFGTGMYARKVLSFLENPVKCFIDNNVILNAFLDRPVLTPHVYFETFQKQHPILICSSYYEEISAQLSLLGYKQDQDYYKLDTSYFL